MLLEGLHIPLTTPFHADGRLNLPKLTANVARYSKTPAAGLIVLGHSGEPTLLSDNETREVLHTAAETAAPEKVLIAGIARDSVYSTLALTEIAAQERYDSVLLGMPAVFATRAIVQSGEHAHQIGQLTNAMLTYFQTVADRSPLPVILLSTHERHIPRPTILKLLAHPNILGLMDADSDPEQWAQFGEYTRNSIAHQREVAVTTTFGAVTGRMLRSSKSVSTRSALISADALTTTVAAVAEPPAAPPLKTRTRIVGFQLIAGCISNMRDSLPGGASAIAPAFAACAPQACYEVYAAWKDNDLPLADEKHARLQEAAQLADQVGPGLLKFGCDLNGYFGGLPRLPHLPPTGENRAALEQLMEGLRN